LICLAGVDKCCQAVLDWRDQGIRYKGKGTRGEEIRDATRQMTSLKLDNKNRLKASNTSNT